MHFALTTNHRVVGKRHGKIHLCMCHGSPKKSVRKGEQYFTICQFKEPLSSRQYRNVKVRHDFERKRQIALSPQELEVLKNMIGLLEKQIRKGQRG